ncbi:MAG TPA: hypothetical protein VLT82_05025 [Myxococcaceae bacterium]|nr:hypothetical protein [Myxococcaceae bacterium]
MSPRLRRCAVCLLLLSLPAVGAPPREDRRAARIRASSSRPEPTVVQPSEAEPIAAAAADAGGVDLAGFLGLLAALASTFVYARGRRLSAERSAAPPPAGLLPPERRSQ